MKTIAAESDTEEFRTERGNRGNRGNNLSKWLAAGAGLATIILAIPYVISGVKNIFKIADAPDQIAALQKHLRETDDRQTAIEASQKDIREGINRILSAMHLAPIKDKDP